MTDVHDASTHSLTDDQVFARIGEEGFARLVRAFYAQIPHDDVLGPMYRDEDLEGAETRLRDFLVFRFGGPQRYIAERGHPRLRMRHAPFAVDAAARDRWVALMDRALADAHLPDDVVGLLKPFFADVATFLRNR